MRRIAKARRSSIAKVPVPTGSAGRVIDKLNGGSGANGAVVGSERCRRHSGYDHRLRRSDACRTTQRIGNDQDGVETSSSGINVRSVVGAYQRTIAEIPKSSAVVGRSVRKVNRGRRTGLCLSKGERWSWSNNANHAVHFQRIGTTKGIGYHQTYVEESVLVVRVGRISQG